METRPCPFCGCKESYCEREESHEGIFCATHCEGLDCNAKGPSVQEEISYEQFQALENSADYSRFKNAIAAWNGELLVDGRFRKNHIANAGEMV